MDNAVSGIVTKVMRDVVGEGAKKAGSVVSLPAISLFRLRASPADPTSRAQKLRLAALGFLGVLPDHIPYSTLHPQKSSVLKDLGKAVDDPRREVRKAAVHTRGAWFLFGGSA